MQAVEQAGFVRLEKQVTGAGDFGSNIYHLNGFIDRLKRLVPDFDRERVEREESRRYNWPKRG